MRILGDSTRHTAKHLVKYSQFSVATSYATGTIACIMIFSIDLYIAKYGGTLSFDSVIVHFPLYLYTNRHG